MLMLCGLQLIQKNLLVNNNLEIEYPDLSGIKLSFSIAVKSQILSLRKIWKSKAGSNTAE